MKPVLVLRPEPEADRTAALLRARGREPIVSPILAVEAVPSDVPAGPFDAVIVSSARAVPHLLPDELAAPAFVVGETTARALRERGGRVRAVAPDGEQLVATIRDALSGGRLVHPCGAHVAFDFAAALAPLFRVERRTVYRTVARPLTPEARRRDAIALLTSPRIATLLAAERPELDAVALSEAVMAAWTDGGGRSGPVAREPTMASLLDALDAV